MAAIAQLCINMLGRVEMGGCALVSAKESAAIADAVYGFLVRLNGDRRYRMVSWCLQMAFVEMLDARAGQVSVNAPKLLPRRSPRKFRKTL
jgi:hypothetical protein